MMPLTVKPNPVLEYGQVTITDSRNAKPSVTGSSTMLNIGDTRVNRVSNPKWRDKVRLGLDASNPYSMQAARLVSLGKVLRTEGSTLGRFMPAYRIDVSGIHKLVGQPRFPSDNFDAEVKNRALKKFKGQIEGRTGSFRAMAPLAESRELADLVKQAVLLTTEFAKSCLEAKRTKGRSFARFMQSTWLGYNFALSPLVSDIGHMGNAIAEYLNREDMDVRIRATATKQWLYSYVPTTTQPPQGLIGFSLYAHAYGAAALSYRYVGGVGLDLKSSNDYTLLQQLGIGFDQIPATLWELTAFSWLFDYFANVGDFLEDVFSQNSGKTRYLVEDRMLKCTVQHEFDISAKGNPNGITPSSEPSSTSTFELVQFQRTPLTALPHATFRIKTADEVSRYGIPKLLNLLSVLKI